MDPDKSVDITLPRHAIKVWCATFMELIYLLK